MRPEAAGADRWLQRIPHDWPGFAGHFPGDPLLPGAELIAAAERCLADAGLASDELCSARFRSPVRPGDELEWTLRRDGGRCRMQARCRGRPCVQLVWRLR